MDYIQISFTEVPEQTKEILIALLSNINFIGFEEAGTELKSVIFSQDFDMDILNKVISPFAVSYSKSTINETNWNEKWEADFQPIPVSYLESHKPFAYIRAHFHAPLDVYPYDIVITPKMSFGTGHHPTTYLMISLMSQMDFTDKRVIDFGTGTGVLAILAEKMGAINVEAIDCDDWSINNTKENILLNDCHHISVIKAEKINWMQTKADIILANINLNIILDNLSALKEATLPGGLILLSGMLTSNEDRILEALKQNGISVRNIQVKENWMAVAVVNKK